MASMPAKCIGSFLNLLNSPLGAIKLVSRSAIGDAARFCTSSHCKKSESSSNEKDGQTDTPSDVTKPSKPTSPMDEFFESEENWNKPDIVVGRSWRKDDLRLKSNSDLHKLWYVLLKERNMLLTMDQVFKFAVLPAPERIYKVEESMKNLEDVVRERNKAYFELETGETGERRCKYELTRIGLWRMHKMTQHTIPKRLNKKWLEEHPQYIDDPNVDDFLTKYKEKEQKKQKWDKVYDKLYVLELMKRFPNVDRQLLQEKYAHLDIEKLYRSQKARGHNVP